MAKRKRKYKDPSPRKAAKMLKEGMANGKKLTKKQKRYFGMIAHRGRRLR